MKRLVCIANSFAETAKWRDSMRLPSYNVTHASPHDRDGRKWRGLSETNNAIVWLPEQYALRLSYDQQQIIKMYEALGMQQFSGNEREKILEWMYGEREHTDLTAALLAWLGSG